MAIPLTKAYYLGMPVYINHLVQRYYQREKEGDDNEAEDILPLEAYPILFFIIVPIAAGFFYMLPALILHIYFPVVVLLGMILVIGLILFIDRCCFTDEDSVKHDEDEKNESLVITLSAPVAMAALCFLAFMSIHFTRQYYVPPPKESSKQFNRNYRYLMRSAFAQLALDGPSFALTFSWPSEVPVIKIKSRIPTHQYFNSLVSRLHRNYHKFLWA